ncbi:OS9 [Bugula neritina]|uniref:OS9 n=1 Tax=Bugula neritina TaxID=10212 RepID=A0A7J7JNV1_BUGNE|nr:OS9 [Bugula neritina]
MLSNCNCDSGDFGFSQDETTLQLSSKYGQRYVCHYKNSPTQSAKVTQEPVADINITDLLEPMRGNCLLKTKDWWSYEFCYGQEVTQFHLENGKKVGQVISLGKYESDKTWLAKDLYFRSAKEIHSQPLPHQQYVNGSVCDLTKKPRRTEIRFSCVEGDVDRIGAIAELESCAYTVFVYTSKICHHPYLRPPVQAESRSIECQPIVSQEIYDEYVKSITGPAEIKSPTDESEDEDVDIDKLLESSLKSVPSIDLTSLNSLTEKDSQLQLQLMEIITKVMSARKGKRTMSKYKESIRKYITSQFDDIIEEAKAELAAEEDGEQSANSLKEIQNLKDTMSRVLEVQLDGLTELERQLDEESPSENIESSKPVKDTEGMSFSELKKSIENIRIETVVEPQQLEVEMIDLEDITESSEFYDAAQAAKEKVDAEGSDTKKRKAVIAILRPMQEKGTRQEEIKHKKLKQNYGRKWPDESTKHPPDEL